MHPKGAPVTDYPILVPVTLACAVAAVIWGRSATRLQRAWKRIDDGTNPIASELALSAFRKELHTTILYAVAAMYGLSQQIFFAARAALLQTMLSDDQLGPANAVLESLRRSEERRVGKEC